MNNLKLVNRISFETFGDMDAPPVILIHGLGLCKDIWTGIIPKLSKHYRVITYDLYGHGLSAPLEEKASLSVFSSQIINLLTYLEIKKAHLIGFSIGGMINRKFAIEYPGKILSLVILNSPHRRGIKLQQIVEDRAKKVSEQGGLVTLDDAINRWFTKEFRLQFPKLVDLVVKWRKLVDLLSYAQAAEALAFGVKELLNQDRNFTIPTLVMTCEKDSGSTPEMAQEIANDYNDSKMIIVPNLKHLGLMENPDAFVIPILKFLERKN